MQRDHSLVPHAITGPPREGRVKIDQSLPPPQQRRHMKDLSRASVLSSASTKSWTMAWADVAETQTSLIA